MAADDAGPTHYERLGLEVDATDEEIIDRYRARVRELHPDLHPEWTEAERDAAEAELIEIVLAQQVLRDSHRRAVYDGAIGVAPAPEPADAVADEVLDGADRWSAEEHEARTHEPPVGFDLFGSFTAPPYLRKPRYWRSEWDTQADLVNSGVSLEARQADLSPLRAYAPDKVWRLRAERLPITDGDLRHLAGIESLQELMLAYTDITDEGLHHICGLPRLRVLDLWGTRISDEGLRVIAAAAATLDRLNVGRTAITDAGLEHLRYMHTLDELNLRGTAVRGPGLVHLHHLVTLDVVALPAFVSRRARRDLARALPALEIL